MSICDTPSTTEDVKPQIPLPTPQPKPPQQQQQNSVVLSGGPVVSPDTKPVISKFFFTIFFFALSMMAEAFEY